MRIIAFVYMCGYVLVMILFLFVFNEEEAKKKKIYSIITKELSYKDKLR